MSAVKLSNLSFSYEKRQILNSINLEYEINDFLSIFGPNGSGKSTLLRLILGLLRPDSGKIEVLGKSPIAARKQIGYVPQFIAINKSFPISVADVVLMGLIDKKIFGFYTKKDRLKALEALERVGMRDLGEAKISELSGGQRQRVYIARALCANAKILLLDEPLASIDTMGQVQIYELLKSLNSEGTGIIMISHDLNLALNYANRAVYVSGGSLHMHSVHPSGRAKFLKHLREEHGHFCSVELALNDCHCGDEHE
ncbi:MULTISPECIES: metal ABC transporter ATP-binding protein [unclassified Campylobacter]|uniref:metal ABC transporter ATP-binding protein n=1 Tax=unclassified Campylobacter TaxID=2593542 RepID=UPI0022E9E39C|nr:MULTISPECIES: ABC transporter ATP-binding protein [unclassified Campylobacter]MDA3062994.1 ABC transporter ATP-binding protein [Campylobacter sp. JMF_14 EL1]MDA3074149.1 ABC transporter ATP-binding protein [Campylobacter sp. JMF_10 EL2]